MQERKNSYQQSPLRVCLAAKDTWFLPLWKYLKHTGYVSNSQSASDMKHTFKREVLWIPCIDTYFIVVYILLRAIYHRLWMWSLLNFEIQTNCFQLLSTFVPYMLTNVICVNKPLSLFCLYYKTAPFVLQILLQRPMYRFALRWLTLRYKKVGIVIWKFRKTVIKTKTVRVRLLFLLTFSNAYLELATSQISFWLIERSNR